MAKVTGPLFGLRANATIAKTITYASWRGVQYARTRVVPANPRTAAQLAVRNVFKSLNSMWLRSPSLMRAPWTAQATGRPYTDRNHFVAINVPLLQGDAALTDMILSPGNGAPPPVTAVLSSGGAGALTSTITPPTAPLGWTLVSAVLCAVLQGDPDPSSIRTPFAVEDLTNPYAPALAGLATGTYVAGSWLHYTDPSGVNRYSISLVGTQAVA